MKVLFSIVAVGSLLVSSNVADAQPTWRADRKVTGSVYEPYRARAYQWNAINHGQVLQYYSQTQQAIPTDTAETIAKEVKHNVTAAQAELAKLAVELKNDPKATALINDVQTHQANALKECSMMETECSKHQAGEIQMQDCCSRMLTELKAAAAAHDKLLEYLKVPAPLPTK